MTTFLRQNRLRNLRPLLKPIIRFCVRHGISIQELFETAKQLAVEVGSEELMRDRHKVNPSRLCALTGLRRNEIQRIWKGEAREAPANYAQRVLEQWLVDPDYLTPAGKPRALNWRGEPNEFDKLVRKVCSDLPYGTILFELERRGLVEKTDRTVRLLPNVEQHDTSRLDEAVKLYTSNNADLFEALAATRQITQESPTNSRIDTKDTRAR